MAEENSSADQQKWWPSIVYLTLLLVGIPWYWPHDNYTIIFGMPAWVIVAIGVSFVASVFTAYLLGKSWPDERAERDK